MRTWKVALSLAVVAAIAAPAIAGTWRLKSGEWVALNPDQRRRLSNFVEDCTYAPNVIGCDVAREMLSNGGQYYEPERVTAKYLAHNFYVSAGAFVLVFALAMIGPGYVAWLRR
jgi:hypothetical protein